MVESFKDGNTEIHLTVYFLGAFTISSTSTPPPPNNYAQDRSQERSAIGVILISLALEGFVV